MRVWPGLEFRDVRGPSCPCGLGRLEMGNGGGFFSPFQVLATGKAYGLNCQVLRAEQRKRFADGRFVSLHVEKYLPLALVKSNGNLLPLVKGQGF